MSDTGVHDPRALRAFVQAHPRLFVLTGAGVSTGSGIPDYRDARGEWKRPAPVQYREFVDHPHTRQRYWARSLVGWPWFADAKPNTAHRQLVDLEQAGHVHQLVTQNVDRLHQRAGSRRVIDLHGRLDRVVCLSCGHRSDRAPLQERLKLENPGFARQVAEIGPDGDAYLEGVDFSAFLVPDCDACGGLLKPDVVFFGESVPRERVDQALSALARADGLLVLGSSLMVYSGFRYCRFAAENGIPIAAVNLGRTRADDLLDLKVNLPVDQALEAVLTG
ncbi:MAG: NAD-dependent protein deacetylase [Gammaproteobacteria bacterium]